MRFGPVGQLAADFALQARKHQPHQRVAAAAAQKIGVRVFGRHEQLVGHLLHGLHVGFDLDPQHLGLLAAVDRQTRDAAARGPTVR